MSGANTPLVELREYSIRFAANAASGNATVDAVNLTIKKGEFVALVGESGSGKSLLAHALAGILSAQAQTSCQTFRFDGLDLTNAMSPAWRDIRGREIGVVFQNPRAALNPVRKVGQQIGDVIARHRLLRGTPLRQAVLEALTAVRIPDPERRFHAYPGELSGGMCQRVMMAIAMAGNPGLLIADEPTTGLDTTTQAAVLDLIREEAASREMACILITHDLALARQYADRILVMHAGQIVEDAGSDKLFTQPAHPYSEALIRATPAQAGQVGELRGIPGGIPDLKQTVPACRFAYRCDRALALCHQERPALNETGASKVACWNPLQ